MVVDTAEEFLAKRSSYDIDGLVEMLAIADAYDESDNADCRSWAACAGAWSWAAVFVVRLRDAVGVPVAVELSRRLLCRRPGSTAKGLNWPQAGLRNVSGSPGLMIFGWRVVWRGFQS